MNKKQITLDILTSLKKEVEGMKVHRTVGKPNSFRNMRIRNKNIALQDVITLLDNHIQELK